MKLAIVPQVTRAMLASWHGNEPIDTLRFWCERELEGEGRGFIIGVLPGPWEQTHEAYYGVCMALWNAGIREVAVTAIPLAADTCHLFWIRPEQIGRAFNILAALPVWASRPEWAALGTWPKRGVTVLDERGRVVDFSRVLVANCAT